jgi:hypothetical protein
MTRYSPMKFRLPIVLNIRRLPGGPGREETANLKPDDCFISDFEGLFAQHANMSTIYSESIKILLTVSSLPILATGFLMRDRSGSATLNLFALPPIISYILLVTPVLDFLMVHVVASHRFLLLFYARGLNMFRRIYFQHWQDSGHVFEQKPLPTDPAYPRNYEPLGSMGSIVHGSAMVNAMYIWLGAVNLFPSANRWTVAASVAYLCFMEVWYWIGSLRAG